MLHAAICAPHRMHRAQIVETLLERGADPNAPTTTGKSNEQVRFFIENDAISARAAAAAPGRRLF